MPSEDRPLLGRQLLSGLQRVTDLMETTKSESQMNRLRRQRAQLLKLIGTLVDENLRQASREYRAATDAVESANRAITRAIRDLKRVAEAIKVLGQALDLVAKLVAA